MLEIFYKTIRDNEFIKIDKPKSGAWIHINNASIEDLDELKDITGIQKSDLIDTLDTFEIPRIEQKNHNIFIFSRHSSKETQGLFTTTLTIILTNHYIITISPSESKLVEHLLQKNINLTTTQRSKLLFHILLSITFGFTQDIKNIRSQVMTQIQSESKVTNDSIALLTKNEEVLNQYLSSLVPLHNVLEAISSGRYVEVFKHDYDLLDDLLIAIRQSEDLCRVNVKSIQSLRDSYQILFTNDVNKTIKFLTAITIIFTIPTIIASIYGMNVSLPLEKSPHAFFIIMNITILLSLLFLYIFVRKKWL
ncbi:MAG TPA: CorA family divalent cation transporter [Chlamydiales bacterium]|nr:CorA family divalent cation transporter [Chlamydiales bacterium]